MHRCQDLDPDDPFPYDRPRVSSWVAAAAVAFAIFILGGFIKTYFQLDALRRDSQREIRELRTMIEGLGSPSAQPSQPVRTGRIRPMPQQSPQAAPPIRPWEKPEPAGTVPAPVDPSQRSPLSIMALPAPEEESRRITYEFGRRSDPPPASRREHLQIISAGSQKMVMIEGGRDMGLKEGARLGLYRDGRWIGDLRTYRVYENMSACEVVISTHPPRPGDLIYIP